MLCYAPIPPEAAAAQPVCDLNDARIDRQFGGLNDAFITNGCTHRCCLGAILTPVPQSTMELERRLEVSGCHPGDTTEDIQTGIERRAGDIVQGSDYCPPCQDSSISDQRRSAQSDLPSTGAELPYLADLTGDVQRQSDSHSHLDTVRLSAAAASGSRRPNDDGGETGLVQQYPISSSVVVLE
jgi:hypothetical protein